MPVKGPEEVSHCEHMTNNRWDENTLELADGVIRCE